LNNPKKEFNRRDTMQEIKIMINGEERKVEYKKPATAEKPQEPENNLDIAQLGDEYILELGTEKRLFPLFTAVTMAERWNVSTSTVRNWQKRYDDFPKPIKGIVAERKNYRAYNGTEYFPFYEVERYEEERGLLD
jgi:hypothetical protein